MLRVTLSPCALIGILKPWNATRHETSTNSSDARLVSVFKTDDPAVLPLATMALETEGIEYFVKHAGKSDSLQWMMSQDPTTRPIAVEIVVGPDVAAKSPRPAGRSRKSHSSGHARIREHGPHRDVRAAGRDARRFGGRHRDRRDHRIAASGTDQPPRGRRPQRVLRSTARPWTCSRRPASTPRSSICYDKRSEPTAAAG